VKEACAIMPPKVIYGKRLRNDVSSIDSNVPSPINLVAASVNQGSIEPPDKVSASSQFDFKDEGASSLLPSSLKKSLLKKDADTGQTSSLLQDVQYHFDGLLNSSIDIKKASILSVCDLFSNPSNRSIVRNHGFLSSFSKFLLFFLRMKKVISAGTMIRKEHTNPVKLNPHSLISTNHCPESMNFNRWTVKLHLVFFVYALSSIPMAKSWIC
jgi:hypothetical protein